MMHNFGCKQITAVENNWYCYLKCLAVKESFKLSNIELLFGDVIEYLKKPTSKFDFVLCSGILYHLPNPIELIHLISLVTENIFIWTHIYDENSSTMKIQNINKALKIYGFINIRKNDDLCDLNHEHGPCISIFASKN